MSIVERFCRARSAFVVVVACAGCGGRVVDIAAADAASVGDTSTAPGDAPMSIDAPILEATSADAAATDAAPPTTDAPSEVPVVSDAIVASDVVDASPSIDAPADTPSATDAGVDLGSTVVPPPAPACASSAAFTAPTWKSPTPFHQGKCTETQLATYEACLGNSSCTSTDATCDACLQTPASAAAYGPVVLNTGEGDGFGAAFVNWGGCQANVDGHVGAGSCGNETNDWQACANAVCPYEACGKELDACDDYAYETICVGHTESDACASEWSNGDSGVPPCAYFDRLATLWCGP